MLDGVLKRRIDPVLGRFGALLADAGLSANVVTALGLGLGVLAAGAIVWQAFIAGLVLILLSRLCDGLDGAVARRRGPSDLGGYLDIVCDYIFYGLIPLAFAIADPTVNALPAAVLLATFYANCASFLAYAVLAEKRGLASDARGPKSFYFSVGLAEASETLIAFALFCLFPGAFPVIAYAFAAMCAWTCAARMVTAAQAFRS